MKKNDFRNQEIEQAAKEHKEKGSGRNAFSFECGAEWADSHPSHETIRKVASITARWLWKQRTDTITWPSPDYIREQLERKPTERQLKAVAFCEQMLDVKFEGDRDDYNAVSSFLSIFLDEAKSIMEDATSSYYSNFDY